MELTQLYIKGETRALANFFLIELVIKMLIMIGLFASVHIVWFMGLIQIVWD